MPGAQTRNGPVSAPLRPRPTVAQGGGRQLGSAQDPCRLGPPSSPGTSVRQPRPARGPQSSRGPPPGLGPLSGVEPRPAPGPLPPEDPPPPGWDPCRLGPRPAPGPPPGRGTLSQPRNPCPPGTPARPGPAARRLTSGRLPGSTHSLPEVPWPSETEPSSPQSRSGRNNGAPGRGRLAAVSARLALRVRLRLPLREEQLPARGCNWAQATRRRTRPTRAPPPRPRRRPALGARPPTNGEGAERRGRGL
ncbi:basic salivary proline-rich protein 3-like [Lagenorhynchus albirostris]|uniref:basic salivary proline-rich protein 3-like n=1 Tax=Lagenorhynchus albirostris TaxID=27610 RepID=UPI0028E254E5|nr:basic salivary proline-rich protein 3-like [Lagenorhynchus albirostris]